MSRDDADAVDVLIRRLDARAHLPTQAHPGDAGWDLYAAEPAVLAPGERALVGTGLAIALPRGYAAFVHPRSGLAHRHGVSIVNAPGTVDAGYRGEIKVNLINVDPQDTVRISAGDRIAQLVIQAVPPVRWHLAETLPGSARGGGGHGSTGALGDNGPQGQQNPSGTQLGRQAEQTQHTEGTD